MADSMDDTTAPSGSVEDLYKDVPTVENAFAGQKKITDEEFEKTYQKLKSKKDKKLKKNQTYKEEYLKETAEKNLLLGLPVTLVTEKGDEIPVGHYEVVAQKVNNKVYFEFYQSYTCVAKVQGTETTNDWNQKTINFVELLPYNEKYIELIYG